MTVHFWGNLYILCRLVWLNGWVFNYELKGCGFESHYSYIKVSCWLKKSLIFLLEFNIKQFNLRHYFFLITLLNISQGISRTIFNVLWSSFYTLLHLSSAKYFPLNIPFSKLKWKFAIYFLLTICFCNSFQNCMWFHYFINWN